MRATLLLRPLFRCSIKRGLKLALLGALATGVILYSCFALDGPTLRTAQSPLPQSPNHLSQLPINAEAQDPEAPDDVLASIQSTLDAVAVPEPQAVADALGVPLHAQGDMASASSSSHLEDLGDLDSDGVPEVALKWLLEDSSEQEQEEAAAPTPGSWRLFLLAWNGTKWQASPLGSAAEDLRLEVITLGKSYPRGITVIAIEGEDAVPYPAVYQVKDHAASLVWDGKAEESRYEGYPRGRVEFQETPATGLTEMLAAGRADPGLLAFPKESRRGFEIRSTYRWDGQAYVPVKTEYSRTPDYTLYRFIAALHLHDFRGAYALLDKQHFLNTHSPTLDKFKKFVETAWPEFLADNVFEAPDPQPGSPDPYVFILRQADKKYVYYPTFSAGPDPFLEGLKRQEEK